MEKAEIVWDCGGRSGGGREGWDIVVCGGGMGRRRGEKRGKRRGENTSGIGTGNERNERGRLADTSNPHNLSIQFRFENYVHALPTD